MVCRQGAALFFFRRKKWWSFTFHELFLSPFAQALPLLFDNDGAFADIDTEESELRRDVHGGKPESLHLLVGSDKGGCVRCALGPSYLFEDSFPICDSDQLDLAFAKAVEARPYQFGAGVMKFLLTLARGTYALPRDAVRKARRYAARDDNREVSSDPNGSDSGAASGPTARERLETTLSERITFLKLTCIMQWSYMDREVSPYAY